jgi:hypothetical protein
MDQKGSEGERVIREKIFIINWASQIYEKLELSGLKDVYVFEKIWAIAIFLVLFCSTVLDQCEGCTCKVKRRNTTREVLS